MKKAILALASTMAFTAIAQADTCEKSNHINPCVFASMETAAITFSPTLTTAFATEGTSHNNKVIYAAKSDAQAYVASNGEVYGAYLAQAIELARTLNPAAAMATDMELAQAILAF